MLKEQFLLYLYVGMETASMKILPTLIALTCFVSSAFAQSSVTIATSDLTLKQQFKPLEGTVWVNVLDQVKSGKGLPDSIKIIPPAASRFYYDKEVYDSLESGIQLDGPHFSDGWVRSMTKVEVLEMIQPFMMKKWEVTNREYKNFLESVEVEDISLLLPDTACWTNDFPGSYNGPMSKVYYAHSKYDEYPVVGVSYYQAPQYCEWYQKKINESFSSNEYMLEVALPNQFEWASANGDSYVFSARGQSNFVWDSPEFYDNNYITNLILDLTEDSFGMLERAMLPAYSNLNRHNFIGDGYMYTTSHKQSKKVGGSVHRDKSNGISYLNTNLSEWCSESYQDNWKDLYELRQSLLLRGGSGNVLLADLEEYFNNKNDTLTGQLVRGGNWVHEHHAFRNDKNIGTHNAKLFVNPNEQHATLGFRYVIRVIPINNQNELKAN
jgi:formylglycine-generating enzyme required for sulfatase activity